MFDPKKSNAVRTARRRFEARELLDRLKSGPCKDCGGQFRPVQMDVYGASGKVVPLARMLHLSKERVAKVVRSGEIVCANCGRIRAWRADRERRSGPT